MTFAAMDAHAAGAIVHGEIGNSQRCHFADPQARLQHKLAIA